MQAGLFLFRTLTGESEFFTVFPLPDECVPEEVDGEPCCLVIGNQPSEVSDMNRIEKPPYLYLTDNVGKIVNIGDDTNVWKVTATIKEGPPGATIEGMTSVAVIGGFANFTNITLSPEGTYVLSFILTDPEGDVDIPPVESDIFNVGPRQLIVKFDTIDPLVPGFDQLNATFNIWDKGIETAASSDVLGSQTWECLVVLMGTEIVSLIGSTNFEISQGI